MAGDVRRVAASGPRGRGPEFTGFLVANVAGFARGIHDGVVVPGRQPELVGVVRPRVRTPTLADHRTELRVRQHIDPGSGRRLSWLERDDVLVSVGREASQ